MSPETIVGIAGVGAYVPYWRLERSKIGEAWGIPALPGERAVAAADEDSLTMAVEAAMAATGGFASEDIGGVIFASTTAPYREKQSAATIAAVLDCRSDVLTLDIADSLRGGTTALRLAVDAVRAGSARAVVVAAADIRLGEPETNFEQMFGDAAGAALVCSEDWARANGFSSLPVTIEEAGGVAVDFVGPWRRDGDPYVRSFEPKLETEFGYGRQAVAAGRGVLERAGRQPGDIARAVIAAPDPRAQAAAAKGIGIDHDAVRLHDLYFSTIGNSGTAAPLVMLAGALEGAEADELVLLVGAGDGADALLLRTTDELVSRREQGRWSGITAALELKAYLPSYEAYVRNRRLVPRSRAEMWSSPVTYWRDSSQVVPLKGMTCTECGTVQFPAWERCMECSAPGPHPARKLSRRGRVFTFTLDHLVLGEYWNAPVPKAVVDLDDGGRVFVELTDCDPDEVRVDMPVELTFRCLHEGADFRNYFWKGRPPRVPVPTNV